MARGLGVLSPNSTVRYPAWLVELALFSRA
jgi:hypothetical protein